MRRVGEFTQSDQVVRILIVDDHAGIRLALRRLLTVENWQICAEAADGLEAIQAARVHSPDVIVMDVSMPYLSGIQAAIEIGKLSPATLIMFVTALELTEQQVRETGARGSLRKSALNRTVDGIRAMLRGEEFHSNDGTPSRDPDAPGPPRRSFE